MNQGRVVIVESKLFALMSILLPKEMSLTEQEVLKKKGLEILLTERP